MNIEIISQYFVDYGALAIFVIVLLEYLNLPGFPAGIIMPLAGVWTSKGEISFFIGASTLARNKNYYKPQKCGLFYVKFYLFLCCTELYFIFICDIMRYETQL